MKGTNKRTQSIASLFASRSNEEELSADNSLKAARVSSGSVRSMKETFSQVEKENEALRRSLVAGAQVQDIDPSRIDPSPFADRFPDEDDSSSFEALVASIAEGGQEVPVLLRLHPGDPERFQTAYGHRRVRAARTLGRPVRAVVRELDDDALAVAQGVENSARQDLTFIERAVFATRLENAGAGRPVIQRALGIDKAEASKLLMIARAVPDDILRQIGRAPRIGRGRWLALAEALKEAGADARVRRRLAAVASDPLGSEERFALAVRAAAPKPPASVEERSVLTVGEGRRLATLVARERDARLVIDREIGRPFAEFVADRLPDLYEAFAAEHPDLARAPSRRARRDAD